MSESLEDIYIYGGFEAWEQPKTKLKNKKQKRKWLGWQMTQQTEHKGR